MKTNKWNETNVGDLSGKVVIVTGSSSGIGFDNARVLVGKNAEVIIAVRNAEKGNNAIEKIKSTVPNANLKLMLLDLSDLGSVKSFAENFKNQYTKLDILINNAGVMIPPYSKTKDGFELQFGTNHLGHFALTALLFDLIKSTPGSRIINVASNAHKMGKLNFEDLQWENRKYEAWKSYGDSKISNLYFTYELARRLAKSNIEVIAAASHPGWTATELQRHSGFVEFLNKLFAQNIEMGALPTLYAATEKDVKNGDYFGPDGWQEWKGYPKKVESNALSKDESIAKQLWGTSEELTGLKFTI
ncbi:MAG: SDR family NAD(P)-dependent oxidoreductase [Melioribacteraceae bacterium]|nr:SDR family NAD(P)-dependent oxidoreductase [Melioribacteraceae bacterium]MCF8264493.1 SDR family NAD(P)-dependent oxidoreductase [Melioribacteraceae bacterium]MCF8411920.1 SDR family NAD(P)-dependent oxidoreductase [Melioribacteraceae bacterium]MCF8430945.1 SDR family NAD(P)-dependent oxidoreductase [Melioribacteraceae bacterium]